MKLTVTYCENCGDGYSDEEYMLGWCCHQSLSTRLETAEEEKQRESAIKSIIDKANKLGW